jgi:hypothetical protein
MYLLGCECPSLDSPALDLATHNVDRVLSHDDEVIGNLVHLLDQTGELVGRLYEHLLLGLTVLAHISLSRSGVGEVVEVDGLVLCHGELAGLQEGGRIRQSRYRDSRGCGGRHFCREEADDIFLFFRTLCSRPAFNTPSTLDNARWNYSFN